MICPDCLGAGEEECGDMCDDHMIKCTGCKGTGKINVTTNLTDAEADEVVRALDRDAVEWIGKPSLFAESCSGKFKYKDQVYDIHESYETIDRLWKV